MTNNPCTQGVDWIIVDSIFTVSQANVSATQSQSRPVSNFHRLSFVADECLEGGEEGRAIDGSQCAPTAGLEWPQLLVVYRLVGES